MPRPVTKESMFSMVSLSDYSICKKRCLKIFRDCSRRNLMFEKERSGLESSIYNPPVSQFRSCFTAYAIYEKYEAFTVEEAGSDF